MIGTTLSHYDITAKLGEGGMGEVFLAEDTKLDRKVALKVLPEELAADPERLERFEREAKTVAALNHPNIVTIHSVEADEGRHFLTMELVEGRTLDQHIPADGLPLARLFDLAIPMADALAEAHAKGITHRDLKPANVMVNEKGQVKILDFGLAKLAEGGPGGEDEATAALTQEGLVVGTVRYMSPEQAKGEPADHRSDVFSLGVLLYEMATAKRPFQGKSSVELLSSILKDDPPSVNEIKNELPNHLGRIVRRCLEKEPAKRYQSALEIRNELADLKREVDSGLSRVTAPAATGGSAPGIDWKAIAPMALAIALAAPFTWWALRDRDHESEVPTTHGAGEARPADASIAVLPFTNRSAEQDTQYFVDGVHDDLLTQLAGVRDLRVISRTSVLEYRDTTKNMRQIGDELGVAHLLEGSVQRAGERVRINVKLIDAETDEPRWSDTFDRDLTPENILAIQTEIAEAIAEALQTTLAGAVGQTLARAPTQNQQAYDLYQQARAIPQTSSWEELSRAIELAERAVELDPEFALAMGEVASKYTDLYWFLSRLPEHREAAGLWLERALALAPEDPRLQFELAVYRYHGYLDYEGALAALDKALIELPGSAELYQERGAILRRSGDFEGAFAAYDKAILLDPRDVTTLGHHVATYLGVGDVEGGRRIARRVESFPGATVAHLVLAKLPDLLLLGETGPAAELLARRGDDYFGALMHLRFEIPLLERRYDATLAVLETLPDPVVAQVSISPHSVVRARVFLAQGRTEAARREAELAVGELTDIAATMPDNPRPIAARALMYAVLGDEAAARADAVLAKELYPVSKDALNGPDWVAEELRALAVFVDTVELAEKLERYLALDSKLYYVDYLLLDPVFDRHRDHPAIRAQQEKYSLRNGAA